MNVYWDYYNKDSSEDDHNDEGVPNEPFLINFHKVGKNHKDNCLKNKGKNELFDFICHKSADSHFIESMFCFDYEVTDIIKGGLYQHRTNEINEGVESNTNIIVSCNNLNNIP